MVQAKTAIALLGGAAIAVAAVISGAVWFQRATDDPSEPVVLGEIVHHGAAAGFNVLLITLDTTRADHLGCYGYPKARTPTIDSLLTCGALFEDAVTSAPTTLASHATILTGLYPPSHGVRDNGAYFLAPQFLTLAEILAGEAYDTAAFVSAFVLDERFGLDQGFAVYEFKADPHIRRGAAALEHERRASDVSQSAITWLRDRRRSGAAKPFFVWVHYFDPHDPYDAPLAITRASRAALYDTEIAYVDLHFRRILDTLDELGLRDRTLLVLVTDHGEGLTDHNEKFHGVFLYESTIRIALMISNPLLFDRPYRVDDRVVGTVDVLPTIVDLLGLPVPDTIDGRSLLTPDPSPDRAIYIETLMPLSMGCSDLRGLRRHTDKYILAPQPEFYNLAQDPGELSNLYDDGGAELEAMIERFNELNKKWSENVAQASARRTISPSEAQRLEALGYLATSRDARSVILPDPKDRIHLAESMAEVGRLLAGHDFEGALELARTVAAQAEGWRLPTLMAAEALMRMGREAERVNVLAEFCDRYPSAEMLFYLAHALLQVKRYEECAEKLNAAELLDPGLGAILTLRGDLYFILQRYAEAVQQYERALEIDGWRLGPEVKLNLEEAKRRMRGTSP